MKNLPALVWAPVAAALLTLVVGAAGFWAGIPWLFPSLAPTIFLQVHKPEEPSAKLYSVLVGHGAGIVGAVMGVLLAQAGDDPSVLANKILTWPRIWAAVIAMAVMFAIQIPLKATHPPAAATALLIALGAFDLSGRSFLVLACGIVLTSVLGEGLRRLRA